ncbi:serine/threonine protein phosphatase [Leptospira congkakensis]|uniref:Serine/threonine protein phosphatase n=1 Tax=Leptospira congkakensis TaxID=2484932 RepID=A0A4Z1AJF8_9LEPT|nr:serine/threonine protein phosphatase [Leptospira congkakensis]TGL89284.1 serine/threonine protein phosphatase [Leptospira congkakensis]TGL97252.1 serine/threonine protein phosphatase [Leptospira congkakensis]
MNFRLFGIVWCLALVSCVPKEVPPKVEKGVLSAESYLRDQTKTIELVGEWEYYPGLLISPTELTSLETIREPNFFKVPGVWSDSFINRGFLAGDGYATFTVEILHGQKGIPLSLKVPEMETAYNLFVDGVRLTSNGIVSASYQTGKPEYRPRIVDFFPKENQTSIVLQISNYHHRKGGPAQVITIGNTSEIHHQYESAILRDMLLVGSILFMGIYHVFLYWNRKKDPFTFWFALTCVLVALRVFITGNKYLVQIFPNLPWELHLKLSYLSFFLIIPIFSKYVYLLFKPYFSRLFYELIRYFGFAFCFIVLVTRSSFYTYLMVPFQIFTLIGVIYTFFVIIRAIRDSSPGSILFLVSFTIFIASFINDVLVNNLVIYGPLTIHFGIFTMFLVQSVYIARNFSKGFVEAENLAIELSDKNKTLQKVQNQLTDLNERLETRVKDKTEELQGKLDQIGKDMKLAKSIIQNVTKLPELEPNLKVDILYKPIAEVGGDIYFIKRIQDFYYRFFLGDATGHGLQAALYSMMIQSEFERVSAVAMRPNDLLFYMNQHFYDKNADLQIYFPALVLDFDFHQGIFRYAGGGVQNQIHMKKDGTTTMLENTGPIIGILEHYRYGIFESKVESGDRLFLFTDGLFEELNESDGVQAWGDLLEVIKNTVKLPFEEVVPSIKTMLFQRMNKSYWKDDSTLICIEIT